jgi:hypothetical protein
LIDRAIRGHGGFVNTRRSAGHRQKPYGEGDRGAGGHPLARMCSGPTASRMPALSPFIRRGGCFAKYSHRTLSNLQPAPVSENSFRTPIRKMCFYSMTCWK